MTAEQRLFALVAEIDRYLAALTPACPQIGQCRDGLAALKLTPARCHPPPAAPAPRCGYLDAALALAREQGSTSLVDAVTRVREHLSWSEYEYPGETIGPRFGHAHAFAELVGCNMPFHAPDYSLGLFLIAPRTLYRDHRHRAPELYAPLTGPSLWRFDHGPWVRRAAHQPIWNEALKVHAVIVEEAPFLCIYVWTRDVSEPAAVVAAGDWAAIEQRL